MYYGNDMYIDDLFDFNGDGELDDLEEFIKDDTELAILEDEEKEEDDDDDYDDDDDDDDFDDDEDDEDEDW